MENMSEALLREIIESVLEGRTGKGGQAGEKDWNGKEAKAGKDEISLAGQKRQQPGDAGTRTAAKGETGEKGAEEGTAEDKTAKEEMQFPDITEYDVREQYLVEHPQNREAYAQLKRSAPCRLGIGKAGARYKTRVMLQFQAAHSAAQDAVFSDVEPGILEELGLFQVQTRCRDKEEFLTRPDLGRKLCEEGVRLIQEKCQKSPQVQILVADGLSSTAVNANVREVLPGIEQGLMGYGIGMGTPFFVKYGRVGVMDEVSQLVQAQATCILIGERPGLLTAKSMSAYLVYKGYVGIPESARTVISNIHDAGTNPAEAGAHIADVIRKILETGLSGTQLKL